MNTKSLVGQQLKLRMHHMFDTVTFKATIVEESDSKVIVQIPQRIRDLKWTEFPRARYAFPREKALNFIVGAN